MKKVMGVINTDQVNKYNMRFTISSLESAYADMWNTGVPSFLNHDHQKPIAWSTVAAIYFEPNQVSTINLTHLPENEREQILVGKMINDYYTKATSEFISQFEAELYGKVKDHIVENFKYCATESAAIINNGIVERLFPKLFENADKHGLIELSKLHLIAPGIFEIDGLIVYASHFFRRSFSRLNTLNTPFLKRFSEISDQGTTVAKIAIDKDMIGLAKSFHEVYEFQYWWGPKFNESLNEIPLGVTQYRNDEDSKHFSDIERTDFWWYIQDNSKTFECEEVIIKPSLGLSEYIYGCRFVHSMVSESNKEPFHLDGAIRIYDEEKILNRWDTDLSNSGKDTDYNKIWRVDGSIKVSEWKELIAHYYRDNMLKGEYFGGKDEVKDFKPEIIQSHSNEDILLSGFIPYHMKVGDGVRFAISYHDKNKRNSKGRKIRALNSIENGDRKERYIESDTFEIIKVLKRYGESVPNMNVSLRHISFEDTIINFPLILHNGQDAVLEANITLKAICELCQVWSNSEVDRAITFNIGIEYESKEIYFSFAGHVRDLHRWVSNNKLNFPTTEKQMGDWSEKAAKYLSEDFGEAPVNHGLGRLLRTNGLLYFERAFISRKMYNLSYDNVKNAMSIEMLLPQDEKLMLKVLQEKKLQIAPSYLIKKTICSNCKTEYSNCTCSKYFDDDVIEIMEDIEMLGVFWTRRSANRF
ncbi:hypothetical protein KQ941_28390 [Paenibacillus xylanexedens]|uniref:hypothetical protein n=1 Tax=Paenibacillus xylanexedens TaxID=528191 RepID=UPI001F3AC16F|nr:hypothetical protein [Paenibacillus xylanexedens]MCF7758363.1 hypothetical protein [Paenibacillus xylanexedens]